MPWHQLFELLRMAEFDVVVVPDQMKVHRVVGKPDPLRPDHAKHSRKQVAEPEWNPAFRRILFIRILHALDDAFGRALDK